MKLEGLDPCHPSLFCVLSVAEVKVLIVLHGCCSPDFSFSLYILNENDILFVCPDYIPAVTLPLRSKAIG